MCVNTNFSHKKVAKMFVYIEKKSYLCSVIIKEMITTQFSVITEFFFLIDVKSP